MMRSMSNRAGSRRKIKPGKRLKRSKSHTQTRPNGRPNRAKPVYEAHVNTQSLSVSDAAMRLGVSASTVKRMCSDSKLSWFRTRGPRGHIRIPIEAVENLRQGEGTPIVPVSSGVVAVKRANVEERKLDLEEKKLEREFRKLEAEDAGAARERNEAARTQRLAAKAKLSEVRLQRAQLAERRRSADEAQAREIWQNRWIAGARNEFPHWISVEQEQILVAAVKTELRLWRLGDDEDAIGQALDRQIQRTIATWTAEREERARREELIESTIGGFRFSSATAEQRIQAAAAIRAAFSELPFGQTEAELQAVLSKAIAPILRGMEDDRTRARREQLINSAAQRLPWTATEIEKAQAVGAVRSALLDLPIHASQAEEQTLFARTITVMTKTIQERVTREQEWQDRERRKLSLISFAVFRASNYLSELRESLEPEPDDEEFGELERDVSAEVRTRLEQELTGNESQEQANRLACEIVDEEVLEHEEQD
jgi:excisionase family DNA binding protein